MMRHITFDQGLHPINPVLATGESIPKEKGRTRVLPDGSLVYHEPLTDIEGY